MGDIADMMLDGVLCECCGVYMGNGDGVPQRCEACAVPCEITSATALKVSCAICGKKIKVAGIRDHIKDVHSKGKK